MLVLSEDRLLCLRADTSDDEEEAGVVIQAASLSLTAECCIEMSSYLAQEQAGTWLKRTWILIGPWAEPFKIATQAPYHSGFLEDNGGNSVMTDCARRLGWQIPG